MRKINNFNGRKCNGRKIERYRNRNVGYIRLTESQNGAGGWACNQLNQPEEADFFYFPKIFRAISNP